MSKVRLLKGDNMKSLKKLEDNSVDSIVTDPPYALVSIKKRFGKKGSAPAKFGTDGAFQRASKGFMGKEWDAAVPTVEFWEEVYRVLKPGGHVLSFGGTRTYHRMVVALEDGGFEIRDQIQWIYGSGFPKSHNVGKSIEKLKVGGIKNLKKIGTKKGLNNEDGTNGYSYKKEYVPGVSIGGKQIQGQIPVYEITNDWEGWGTALKPAVELICMARKPLSEKTIAKNVLEWGTGGINIDGCRVGSEKISSGKSKVVGGGQLNQENTRKEIKETFNEGRFPANLIFECTCDEVVKGEIGEVLDAGTASAVNVSHKWGYGDIRKRTNYTDTNDTHTNPDCPCYMLDEQSGMSKSKKQPSNRPICMARKPLSEKTIAKNVLKWGTGGINIDGCRVGSEKISSGKSKVVGGGQLNEENTRKEIKETFNEGRFPANLILECICDEVVKGEIGEVKEGSGTGGIWTKGDGKKVGRTYNDTNDTHTNPDCPCYILDEQSGELKSGKFKSHHKRGKTFGEYQGSCYGKQNNKEIYLDPNCTYGDKGGASRYFKTIGTHTNPDCPCYILDEQSGNSDYSKKKDGKPGGKTFGGGDMKATKGYWPKDKGGASRYFKTIGEEQNCRFLYSAKVSKKERNMGMGEVEDKQYSHDGRKKENETAFQRNKSVAKNNHPTVKPIKLMAYLCRLITPPGGVVLDPFMGSGSTGMAAVQEDFDFIGMEMDNNYFEIAVSRIKYVKNKKGA